MYGADLTMIEKFKRLKYLRGEVERLKELEAYLLSAAERVTSMIGGLPTANSPEYSRVETFAIRFEEAHGRRLQAEFEQLSLETECVEIVSTACARREVRDVMLLKFVEGRRIGEIAAALSRTPRQVFRLLKRGKAELASYVGDDEFADRIDDEDVDEYWELSADECD